MIVGILRSAFALFTFASMLYLWNHNVEVVGLGFAIGIATFTAAATGASIVENVVTYKNKKKNGK